MPRRPFKKKKSSRGTNPFDDSAGSLSLGDPSDAADNAQEETLGLKLHDSSKLNETITSGSSEEDDDNDGNVNMRERLGSGDQQVEEEYGFSSIAGNGRGGGGGRTTADIAEGLDTLDDALDDLDTEPLERGNKKRGSGRFSFLNTSNWSHPKYCWRRQAMSRMGKSHMKNGLGHDERKARRKMLLIVMAVVLVILAALAGSIAAWQVITKKNSEQQQQQQQIQDGSDTGGDESEDSKGNNGKSEKKISAAVFISPVAKIHATVLKKKLLGIDGVKGKALHEVVDDVEDHLPRFVRRTIWALAWMKLRPNQPIVVEPDDDNNEDGDGAVDTQKVADAFAILERRKIISRPNDANSYRLLASAYNSLCDLYASIEDQSAVNMALFRHDPTLMEDSVCRLTDAALDLISTEAERIDLILRWAREALVGST